MNKHLLIHADHEKIADLLRSILLFAGVFIGLSVLSLLFVAAV